MYISLIPELITNKDNYSIKLIIKIDNNMINNHNTNYS